MLLSVANQLDSLRSTPYTFTAVDISAGGTVLGVRNINQFTNQYAIQIGRTGEEQAEIQTISGAPSGTTITTAGTLVYNHSVDTPIYQIGYNKVIFKRSTSGTAGTATALTNGTVTITPDHQYTEFNDTSGASTYAYKTQYYNSVTGDLSAESDWFLPGGPGWYSLQKIRERTKNRLKSANFIKEDSVIDDWVNEYLEELNTAAININKDYLLGTTAVTFGTTGLGTITATDFVKAVKVEVNYSGTTYLRSGMVPVNQFDDTTSFSDAFPSHAWVGETVLKILPANAGGTVRVTYATGVSVLDSDGDELPHPMRHYTRGFTYYSLACALELDGKDAQAKLNYDKAQRVKMDFIKEITPRDNTGVQYIELVEGLTGDSDVEYF